MEEKTLNWKREKRLDKKEQLEKQLLNLEMQKAAVDGQIELLKKKISEIN